MARLSFLVSCLSSLVSRLLVGLRRSLGLMWKRLDSREKIPSLSAACLHAPNGEARGLLMWHPLGSLNEAYRITCEHRHPAQSWSTLHLLVDVARYLLIHNYLRTSTVMGRRIQTRPDSAIQHCTQQGDCRSYLYDDYICGMGMGMCMCMSTRQSRAGGLHGSAEKSRKEQSERKEGFIITLTGWTLVSWDRPIKSPDLPPHEGPSPDPGAHPGGCTLILRFSTNPLSRADSCPRPLDWTKEIPRS